MLLQLFMWEDADNKRKKTESFGLSYSGHGSEWHSYMHCSGLVEHQVCIHTIEPVLVLLQVSLSALEKYIFIFFLIQSAKRLSLPDLARDKGMYCMF